MGAVSMVGPGHGVAAPGEPGWVPQAHTHDGGTDSAYWDGTAWTAVVRQRQDGKVEDQVLLRGANDRDLLSAGLRLLDLRRVERRRGSLVAAAGLSAGALAAVVIGLGIANFVWPGWFLAIGLPLVVTCGPTIGLLHAGRGRGPCTLFDEPPKQGRRAFEGHRVQTEGVQGWSGTAAVLVVIGVTLATLLALAAVAAMIIAMLVEAANQGL